ncbi:NUDIX domain-containing protein [Paenibacillus arenilitoris]|uniref:NUDIX domain-containing protein n=1 Tax=Paenibacillus arenilitoris TaxID=2772299 RepID=A0A927CJH9_9BACL|nr:NUDIX domain-containing protein [Paenibacillus arenilitoris]MBD2868257.1 NUDIX domain-containing protein [Paenibacillus arenilitoris]
MKKGQDASGIAVIDGLGRVLLVHQTYGKRSWALPGGMVEEGESAWDAALRELKEEAGISAVGMELSGLYFQPHKNRYIYTFKSFAYEGDIAVDQDEIDEYGFFDVADLPRPISSFTVERIKDALAGGGRTVFREERLAAYEVLY